ncbi:family 43 glycosylhydrolase [Dysgonomonas sp. GY75]|uniref:RICIN domain-containing protein n=1 Tax=Dysgonomonas sp. GY75 TaxID=2780419 RepID=UPI0018844A7F|nr:family 43 glycosylhydrolase [Dysgonomonas sp. GY75]MBF0648209.1 family 43 glycosylhydrolase [Dysgonomonas sp. GY75]
MKKTLFFIFFAITSIINVHAQNKSFKPGVVWNDTSGSQINAHGGCVVYSNNAYYWFGEDRTGMVSNGVSCYKSTDLYNWKRVRLAMATTGERKEDMNDISQGRLFERPKVVYNKTTNKWVMWSHWETGEGYGAARVCVAVSDNVEGPYNLYKTSRPNGQESRDQTLFLDTDGKAYHFCSTDMNTNTYISLLRDDYLEPAKEDNMILKGMKYEAASIFKFKDIYFGLFSGCTGWNPNPGHSAYTTDILSKWHTGFNFAVDPQKHVTYRSQSCYVLKVEGKENAYIYMGDRWNSKDVGKSDYVWLPINMRSGYPTIRWYDEWNLSVFDDMYRYKRAKEIKKGNVYALLEKQSNRLVSKPENKGFTIEDDNDDLNLSLEFIPSSTPTIYQIKDTKSGKLLSSVFGTLRLNTITGDDSQLWLFESVTDGYYNIKNVRDGKYLTVSGSSTFAGTGLYLSVLSNKYMQDFAVYFDSKKYKYEEADIFSKAYRQNPSNSK